MVEFIWNFILQVRGVSGQGDVRQTVDELGRSLCCRALLRDPFARVGRC